MASAIESDGRTVTVTTEEGHRIGFAAAELEQIAIRWRRLIA